MKQAALLFIALSALAVFAFKAHADQLMTGARDGVNKPTPETRPVSEARLREPAGGNWLTHLGSREG